MLELRLLGVLELYRDGTLVTDIQANKTLALLNYLAVTGGSHTRSALAGLLWGGMPEAKARDNLSKALSTLRQVVGTHLTIVIFRSHHLSLKTCLLPRTICRPNPPPSSVASKR